MKITVCELPEDRTLFSSAWSELCTHVRSEESDIVLLPEMPFARWGPAKKEADPNVWADAVEAHDDWYDRHAELSPAAVLGSRPTLSDRGRLNEGFVWTPNDPAALVHKKTYLPDEKGFWEATWYERGDDEFSLFECNGVKTGYLICTELWAAEEAREYGQAGAHLIANPRATETRTLEKWRAGARAMSTIAGAFLASSNRVTITDEATAETPFGGGGWIVDPDGTILAETSRSQPFTTVDVDLEAADAAKETYPRSAFNERPSRPPSP